MITISQKKKKIFKNYQNAFVSIRGKRQESSGLIQIIYKNKTLARPKAAHSTEQLEACRSQK